MALTLPQILRQVIGMKPTPLETLVELLTLEETGNGEFVGESQDLGWGTIFGGQVLGQSLAAAFRSLPSGRAVHSLHAYFLRAGQVDKPITFKVQVIREGRSFSACQVLANQEDKAIFSMMASFHGTEQGFDHQAIMPNVPSPTSLASQSELARAVASKLPPKIQAAATKRRAIEIRPVEIDNPFSPTPGNPKRSIWYSAAGELNVQPFMHQCLLAYASDFSFLTTALRPHGISWLTPGIKMASLDHAIWFHRPFRMDEWLLHSMESPSAHGARGFVQGQIYNENGQLVASTAQEGVIRLAKWQAR